MDWEVAGQNGEGGATKSPKRKGRKMKKWAVALLVIAVIVVVTRVSSCVKNQPKSLAWPTSGLATLLPDPPTKKGEVIVNSDDAFSATISNCDESQYNAYVESCKQKGFTTDAESMTQSYEAYTEDGNHLRLSYYSSSKEISVMLDAAVEMGDLAWPTSGAGALVPAPASKKGKVSADRSTYFSASVGDTDASAFAAYADACIAAGFNVDYSKGDTSFSAKNADGVKVSLSYKGFNTMEVSVDSSDAPSTPASAPAENQKSDGASASSGDSSASSVSGGVTPSFKETMDSYEDFMNQYVDFMKKYKEAGNDAAMLADYGKMMTSYADWVSKIDDIDEDALSASDCAYYLEVQGRVTQKLAEIGQ